MPDGFLGIPNGNDKELKMAQLSLKHIQKIYDNQVHVVKDFNLEIEDKEFFVFVGPSGWRRSPPVSW